MITTTTQMQAIMIKFGKTVAKARKDKNMSLEELASQVGTTKGHLANLEKGKRRLRISTILDLSEKLNIEVRIIFKQPKKYQHNLPEGF